MARGLPVRPFPVFLAGGLDTKTDPRLVPAGSMLEVENMFYQRTGELRLRNGFATLTGAALITEIAGLWNDAVGNPVLIGQTTNVGSGNYVAQQRYASSLGWELDNAPSTGSVAYPAVTCERIGGTSGEAGVGIAIATSSSNPLDGDVASDGTTDIHTWFDANFPTAPSITNKVVNRRSGAVLVNTTQGSTSTRPAVAVAVGGGTPRLCAVVSSAGNVVVTRYGTNGQALGSTTVAATLDAAAQWIDARAIPGTTTILIVYKLTAAGGVGALVYDPVGNTTTIGPVAIATADATMALGICDDSLTTGSLYLMTAGATDGVKLRVLNATTLAVTSTITVDATATANVRQVTGHVTSAGNNLVVHWDVTGTPTYLSKVRRSIITAGTPVNTNGAYGVSLYSRSFKANDGRYYLVVSYDSATQPTLMVIHAVQQDNGSTTFPAQQPMCVIFAGNSAGRRQNQSSLTSAWTDSQGRSVLSAGRKVTTASASQERIALTFGKPIVARELGGLRLSSGGVVMQNDGTWTRPAVQVVYLEPVTAASTAGGSMTPLKTYSYVVVIVDKDAQGNQIRSAKSVPASVVIAAGQGSATLTIQNPRIAPRHLKSQTIEVYRAGPAEDGDTGYNKVGETYSDPYTAASDTLSFVDTMSDINSELGETLYSTGNVLENFVTPSTRLLEVCNQRAWIVSAETPDELWPSKQLKSGTGVNFNPLLAFRVTGDGYGAITALAAQDGQLIAFKSSAIYVISGDGPNDLGQGSFNSPRPVSLSNGTTVPASVVATPAGVMFQSTKGGIWMLDRGLGLSYVGQAVESFTTGATIVGASLVNGTTQARFVLANGRCLVFDYAKPTATTPGTWTTFLLRVQGSTVVACADIPAGWCYACADGRVYQETAGVFSDVNSVSTIAIVPAVTFPVLATAGINGFARLYAVEILGEYVGDHTLVATLTNNYDLVTATAQQFAVTAATPLGYQFEIKPANQKGGAYRLRLTATLAAGSGAFRLSAITLLAGIKKGSNVPFTKRLA